MDTPNCLLETTEYIQSDVRSVWFARETRLRRSTETAVFLGSRKNPIKFYSRKQVVEEDGYNVVAALPKADIITSPSLQRPKRKTIQNSVVNRQLRDRNSTEKLLPFIFNRKRTKRRIGFVRKCGNSSMTSPVKRRKPRDNISKRRKKRIHGVGHQILKREVVQESNKVPIYPNYHHSSQQVLNLYKSFRKGSVFWPSKKVLWRNRHRLYEMSKNRLRNVSGTELYGACVREKEYEANEPPEEDDVSSSAELNSVTFTMGLG